MEKMFTPGEIVTDDDLWALNPRAKKGGKFWSHIIQKPKHLYAVKTKSGKTLKFPFPNDVNFLEEAKGLSTYKSFLSTKGQCVIYLFENAILYGSYELGEEIPHSGIIMKYLKNGPHQLAVFDRCMDRLVRDNLVKEENGRYVVSYDKSKAGEQIKT